MYQGAGEKMRERLDAARTGTRPWISTLTPAEMLVTRSHGFRPLTAVSATCWMHYGYSWTLGHAEGWHTALARLKSEALRAGANAVVDVKMRTVRLNIEQSMDFTLVGTAMRVDALPESKDPIVATVSALEFVRLLDADVVPVGIAVGANYEWWADYGGRTSMLGWMGNIEAQSLSTLYDRVRKYAHADLRTKTREMGNGALGHITFSEMFKSEPAQESDPVQYLARHIVIATVVDLPKTKLPLPDVQIAVDLHPGVSPLRRQTQHHQSYASNQEDGAI